MAEPRMEKFLDRVILFFDDRQGWQPASDVRTTEARWRRENRASRARGCPCGKPATTVARQGLPVGRVPYERWTCKGCQGASGWTGTKQPVWD